MFKWMKRLRWLMSEDYIKERRHAHRMILISSMPPVYVKPNKKGKMQIEHIKVSEDE